MLISSLRMCTQLCINTNDSSPTKFSGIRHVQSKGIVILLYKLVCSAEAKYLASFPGPFLKRLEDKRIQKTSRMKM